MMLNSEEILDLGLITSGFHQPSARAAGYDLRIRSMVEKNADGTTQSRTDCIELPPQGVAVLISEETIKLPKNICAYASVKTSLCREGVLAINSGVIDPGWNGPLSSLMLNFGRDRYTFWKGDVFLRLTFHRLPDSTIAEESVHPRSDYEVGTLKKFQKHLAASFMDFDTASRQAMLNIKSELKSLLFKYVPLAVGALAIITFLMNIMNFGTIKWSMGPTPSDLVMARAKELTAESTKKAEQVQSENVDLKQRIVALENRINNLEKVPKKE